MIKTYNVGGEIWLTDEPPAGAVEVDYRTLDPASLDDGYLSFGVWCLQNGYGDVMDTDLPYNEGRLDDALTAYEATE